MTNQKVVWPEDLDLDLNRYNSIYLDYQNKAICLKSAL